MKIPIKYYIFVVILFSLNSISAQDEIILLSPQGKKINHKYGPLKDEYKDYKVNVRSIRPEIFGAKGDGKTNDTKAIQTAINILSNSYGGVLELSQGEYLVDSIKLGIKTSIIGAGSGVSIIRQTKTSQSDCIIISSYSASLEIENLSIIGNNKNNGIYFENTKGEGEHHEYISTLFNKWTKKQPYKWISIHDLCIYNFDIGLFLEAYAFNVNIYNCTFGKNGDGVIMNCTDSFISNCYVNNNKRNGICIIGGNNKLSNIKSIFNGEENAPIYAAVYLQGNRCQLINVETQDNYCKGFYITGQHNMISNCMSNTDGYTQRPYKYDESTNACGFMIDSPYNHFSNCIVTNYNEKYGAIYKTPIIIKKDIEHYYPNIYNEIRTSINPNKLFYNINPNSLFNSPCKNEIINARITNIDDKGKYFKVTSHENTLIKNLDQYHLENLNVLIDFRTPKELAPHARLWSIGNGNESLELVLVNEKNNSFIALYSSCGLNGSVIIKDLKDFIEKDNRIIVSFFRKENSDTIKTYASIKSFLFNTGKGWIKKETIIEIPSDIANRIKRNHSYVQLGKNADKGLFIKRVIMSYSPIDDSLLIPGSNVSNLYNHAFIYIDADTYKEKYYKNEGNIKERPILSSTDIGYQYFDHTINKPIWWNGNKWVDANGNEL